MNWNTSEDAREMLRHSAAYLPRTVLVRVLCNVAETALPYCDDDSICAATWAWGAARRWCRGETDLEEVEAAWEAGTAAGTAAAQTPHRCANWTRAADD